MKRMSNKLFLYSLTSLAVTAASVAHAEELAYAPTLEGGLTASVGTFYAVPSVTNSDYFTARDLSFGNGGELVGLHNDVLNTDGEYDWGFEASIGYIFPETANGIELSYRGLDTSSHDSNTADLINFVPFDTAGEMKNKYQSWDLMISQFLDVGDHMQMRFLGGIAYLSELEQTKTTDGFTELEGEEFELDFDAQSKQTSSYTGLGPRVGVDARYNFGESKDENGFGIVGGGSVAYYLGDLDSKNHSVLDVELLDDEEPVFDVEFGSHTKDELENHAVTNFRANLGVDYVYFFDNEAMSTLGLELGYQVDAYFNGVGQVDTFGTDLDVSDITFSGPYLNLKGAF